MKTFHVVFDCAMNIAYFYRVLGVIGMILLVTYSVGCSASGQEDGYILDALDHYEPVSGQVQTSNLTDNECHNCYYYVLLMQLVLGLRGHS